MKALKTLVATAGFVALATTLGAANAALVVTGSVGGAPTGTNKWNLDGAPVGLTYAVAGNAGFVTGTVPSEHAAPWLSGSNGTGFGAGGTNQPDGADATSYGTAGTIAGGGNFTLQFSGLQQYFGLLWGSVDGYNILSFFDGLTTVGSITGSDAKLSPNGNQGVNGTLYVNINSDVGFDRVVFTSTSKAFEFDNVAWAATRQDVPEPGSLALLGLGLAGLAAVSRRKQKQA